MVSPGNAIARSGAGHGRVCVELALAIDAADCRGLVVAELLRRRGSAVQSLVYRTTLAAVLVSPLATWTISLCGVSGWSVEMPPAWTHSDASGVIGEPVEALPGVTEPSA